MDKKKLQDFIQKLQEVAMELNDKEKESALLNQVNDDESDLPNPYMRSTQHSKITNLQLDDNLFCGINQKVISGSEYFEVSSEESSTLSDSCIFYGQLYAEGFYNDSTQYMVIGSVTVLFNKINRDELGDVTNVYLRLKKKPESYGDVYINGQVYPASLSEIDVDISDKYLSSSGYVRIEPYTTADDKHSCVSFYTDGANGPKLIIYHSPYHSYKDYYMFGDLNLKEDILNNSTVWLLNDVHNNGMYGLNVYHVIRKNGFDDGESEYYGPNTRLNFSERLLRQGDSLYYLDPLGDAYFVINNTVNGMELQIITPDWINSLPLFESIKEKVGTLRWLIAGNLVKGFNSDGYLVFLSDTMRHLFYLDRSEIYNILVGIDEVSGTTKKSCYLFRYYDPEEYGYNYLMEIYDYLNGRHVSYNYNDSRHLTSLTQIKGATYTFSYDDDDNITQVTSSEGYIGKYAINVSNRVISVQSARTAIPNGTATLNAPKICEWIVQTDDLSYTVTDIDEVKEYYTYNAPGNELQGVFVVGGKVQSAYKTKFISRTSKLQINADRSCLFVPYENFSFINGETVSITLNTLNNPVKEVVSNRKISVNTSQDYTAYGAVKTYFYDGNNRCTKQITDVTLDLYDGTTNAFRQIVEYTYNDRGLLASTTSYVDGETSSRRESIESNTYTFSDDGTYEKEASWSRKNSGRFFRSSQTYDTLGRIISQKDLSGNYSVNYTYVSNTDRVHSINCPGYPIIYHMYDNGEKLLDVFYTYTDTDEGTIYVGNYFSYDSGELIKINCDNDNIDMQYDSKRRLVKLSIEGNVGSKDIDYSDRTVSGIKEEVVDITNENGEKVTVQRAKNNEYVKIFYAPSNRATDNLQVQYNYDIEGKLLSISDKLSNENVTNIYNSLGQLIAYREESNGSNKVKENYTYDPYGKISGVNISGQVNHTYGYSYDSLSDRRFNGMSFAGITENVYYDSTDRLYSKHVYYNNKLLFIRLISHRNLPNCTNEPEKVYYSNLGDGYKYVTEYTYNTVTGQISRINSFGKEIGYRYTYGKLMRENNELLNKSHVRYYDDGGNAGSETVGAYTGQNTTPVSGTYKSYSFVGDKMMSYGNLTCVYDNMGNPTTYLGKTATWKGRQLTSFNGNTFTYDGRGRRMSKNGISYIYDSQGRVIRQSNGLEFFYDYEGIAACRYNDQLYLYITDGQGNVIALIDTNGNEVVQYWYDAWGNHKVVDANGNEITSSNHLGNLNPFRYRGYYYDTETGLYFLQTRYYDPEVGRFLNRDSVQYADPETINGLNLYAYCLNNPVEYVDPTGEAAWYEWLVAGILIIGSAIAAPLTMGTSLVAAGALAAVALGGTISIVNQVSSTGDFEMNQFAVDIFGSALSGALAGTGLSVAIQVAGNFFISVGTNLMYTGMTGNEISISSLADSSLSGFISGLVGGNGALYLGKAITLIDKYWIKASAGGNLINAIGASNLVPLGFNFLKLIKRRFFDAI